MLTMIFATMRNFVGKNPHSDDYVKPIQNLMLIIQTSALQNKITLASFFELILRISGIIFTLNNPSVKYLFEFIGWIVHGSLFSQYLKNANYLTRI
jgi:hypothetical protein